jgi:nucleoside-diphosphate-sugar epimerase
VALPLTLTLAADSDSEVWGLARFTDAAAKKRLEDAGVNCVTADLAEGRLDSLPDDFTYVLNFSVLKSNNWDYDLDANAGGLGSLMSHCRSAQAFLHCSSTAVYQPNDHHVFAETDPLGDNHRIWDFIQTYSICKISAEAMARFCARQFQLPTVIARLNVPYGDNGGWPLWHLLMMKGGIEIPVHTDAPTIYNPIHDDDILAFVPKLLDLAAVPVPIVNLGGDDTVSVEGWCAYIGELTGFEPTFRPTDKTLESVSTDNTKRQELLGPTSVHWKDGLRRMIQARHPELLKK